MVLASLLVLMTVAVLTLPGAAPAFRNVEVGAQVPALTLDAGEGRQVRVTPAGRPTVLLFWRPGQPFSEEALADLVALGPGLSARGVGIVALAEAGSAAPGPRRPSIEGLTDRGRRAADAFGVIVFPSTAVIDGQGVLRAYLPSRNSNYRTLVDAHVRRALGEISEADLAARLTGVGEIHGRNAEAAQAAYKRGVALAADGRFEDAAPELARALALQPDLSVAHLQLGFIRLELNEPEQALKEFGFVLAKNPASPGARVGIGVARIRLGQADEGIRLLEEAVVLNPEPVRGHYELGRAYEARGETARAVYHYRWAFLKLLQGRK